MKVSGRLLLAAFIGVLGLWLLFSKGAPPQRTPVALRPGTEPLKARTPDEPAPPRDGSLSGSVRRADGKAIEGSRVCATTVDSEVFWAPESVCATTDQSGSYRIAPLANTVYVVSAVAQGFRPGSASSGRDISLKRGEARTGLDIVLAPGGAQLSGHVIDATGGPISGATVRVLRRAALHDTTVTKSGPDGSFAVWTAAGPVTVLAEASQYAAARIAHVAPSSDLILRLTPSSTMSGRVVAENTGAPVAGVRVRAIWPGTWNDPTQPSALSDAGGAFEIRGLEPGRYALIGEGIGWRGEVTRPIEVGLASLVDQVTLTVSSAAVVTGRVVRRGSDEPCSRGSVTLGPDDSAPSFESAARIRKPNVPVVVGHLEADGTTRVNAVPAGSYQVDVQCADSLLVEGPTTLEVGHDNVDGIVWKVDPGTRVVVRAVDESGQPAANVHLFLRQGAPEDNAPREGDGRRPPPFRSFVTSVDGTSEVTGLAPAVYTIEPAPGHQGQPVAVDARNSDKVEATVRLAGRGSIVVSVRTPEGTAVDQVQVRATPVGENRTSPSPDGNGKQAAPGSSSSRASFPGAGMAGNGMGNGQFEIGPLGTGSYRVTVSDGINPPREPRDWPQGIVKVSAGVVRATVILQRGGSLTGRVVDAAGQPLPDLWVSADCTAPAGGTERRAFPRIAREDPSSRTISDSAGRFRIDRIASDARCALRAQRPGDTGIGVAKDVRPGNDTVITFLEPGSLSGTAMAPDGAPMTRFQLTVRAEDGETRTETISTTDGHWSLSRVAPGHLLLSASDRSLAAEARVDLASGARRDGVELQFGARLDAQQPSPEKGRTPTAMAGR